MGFFLIARTSTKYFCVYMLKDAKRPSPHLENKHPFNKKPYCSGH